MQENQPDEVSESFLEREIESALAVEPSPELFVKVCGRIASEERPGSGCFILSAMPTELEWVEYDRDPGAHAQAVVHRP
jgi:hypothetical protein